MAEHRQEGAFGNGGALSRRRGPEKGGDTKRAGSLDARVARTKELHAKTLQTDELTAHQRAQRDELIMRLRKEDPKRWSYGELAAAIGCSRELIALVMRRNEQPA